MIEIEPLTPHIGARIHGLSLAHCTDSDFEALYQAFLAHQVVFIEKQTLTPEQHLFLASRFGELEPIHPFFPNVPSHPQVCVIETTRGNAPLESLWHTDLTWRNNPSKCSLLHAQHLPLVGGDTMWCSMTAVFESLSSEMQDSLRALTATHSLVAFEDINPDLVELDWHKDVVKTSQDNPPVIHNVVQQHPETGKETLYINEQFTRKFNELEPEKSQTLLNKLFAIARQPEFQVRYKWAENAMAIWDNRVTQHYAVIDYGDTPRKLHRVTVT
ncbi:taurine dioxygenase [Vibrio nigripulchritudo]|uniref:TauD/TfdA dioxygenase family protein n=1 Tax=Vibrio nigripulchritudo TaxID=28173 RepID=UPI00190A6EFB|nr:TauD/TfdA family dioxygenase [Vibrio nigripulchritudo]BCL72265.1 taurine dioxygenase [Vibrio nigripulchritudo]BDU33624.1 taurine dioxygenase [Vibrio nigripulchritudo]